MPNEQLTMGSAVENRKENSFLSQLKNLKHAIELTATLLLAPIAVTGQTTADTTKVENNKTQIEVVQQDPDPVKDLMKKYKVETLVDVEVMDLKDMIDMLKEAYHIAATDEKIKLSLSELTKKLEDYIDGSTRDFDFASLKPTTSSNTLSDEEKELDKQLAQKTAEIQTKKDNITKLKQEGEKIRKETEEVKKVIAGLTGKQE